ncbi:MAG: tail fiber protein [Candidatus Thiodiazotropha sp.]
MADRFIGEIRMFGGNYAPEQWAYCDGQVIPVSQNEALFSLLGSTYGGDGRSNFQLPDCRGRLPMNFGSGAGLTQRRLGSVFGVEAIALNLDNLPSHTHQMLVTNQTTGNLPDPQDMATAYGQNIYAECDPQATGTLADESVKAVGLGTKHNNMMPYYSVHFIIALTGEYPTRS